MNEILVYNLNNFGLLDKGYEIYLREFINNSHYFQSKCGTFYAPISETHGEDDANATNYSLDFKRFVSQDECRYRRIKNIPVKYNIALDDKANKTLEYYDMFRCMKNLDKNELYEIQSGKFKFKDNIYQKEIVNMVDRLLMKNKNIMLYFPKIIVSENVNDIIDFINNALIDMVNFRSENVKKDLYFTFIYSTDISKGDEYKFIILKHINGKLKLIDSVDTICSEVFYKKL